MSVSWRAAILAGALVGAPAPTGADVPRARPEPRQVEGATHVVMGVVTGVYSAEPRSPLDGSEKGTMYLLEIMIERLEKGAGPKVDELLYVRGVKGKQEPSGPSGQTTIPRLRDRVRAYMKRDRDGGYDLIMPDGIEVFVATKN